jgi:hypothetical protein
MVAPTGRQLHADGPLEEAMEAVDRALVAAIIVLAGVLAARNIRLPPAHPEPRRAALPFGEDPGINLMRAETQVDAVDADDEHRLQCIKQAARYDPEYVVRCMQRREFSAPAPTDP